MFTGLIESIGTLQAVERRGANKLFRVLAQPALTAVRLGDSIALDGYCQTVVEIRGDAFAVEVSPETLAVTTAAQRQVGDKLNLERALALGDRLGGHLVAGHVDGVGTIRRIQQVEGFVKLAVAAPEAVRRYCVAKGSIALDGVSLTINVVDERGIELGIIPTTWTHTTLADKKVGDRVNLEADLIGKYVERFLAARLSGEQATASRLDEDFLAKHGFVK